MNPSIVDYLNKNGQASDYNSRFNLATSKGIKGYTGSANQNTQLLGILQSGTPTTPTTPTGNVITSDSLIKKPALTLPTQNTGTSAADTALMGNVNNVVNTAQANQWMNEATTKDNASNHFAKYADLLSTKGARTEELNKQLGVEAKGARTKDLEAQILVADQAFKKQTDALYGQGGTTREQVQPAITEANRLYASQNADRAIAYHLANQDYTSALDTVEKKVNAEFQGYKDQLDALNTFITQNKQLGDADRMALENKYAKGLIDYKASVDLANYAGTASIDAAGLASDPNYTPKAPVGYTVTSADSGGLYSIAQKIAQSSGQNVEEVFQALKDANPNLAPKASYNDPSKAWAIKVGDILNLPSAGNPPPTNGSLLAATGLSQLAMEYLKSGTTALTRLDKVTRQKVFNEVQNYTKSKGIDEATFRQQYSAIGKTVESNTLRNNQAKVAENELSGTIDNLRNAAQEANLGNLKGLNVAKIWKGTQLNDPSAETFKFHLEQLRNEFSMYNAALSGQLDANGNIRQTTDGDLKRADEIIQNGLATGSIDGFEKALKSSTNKMGSVLKNSIDAQNKQVWDLFGVGDKYKMTYGINDTVNMNKDPLGILIGISSSLSSNPLGI